METNKAAGANNLDKVTLQSCDADSNAGVSDLECALALAPDNLDTLHSSAEDLFSKGRLNEARAVYHRILNHENTNIRAIIALSRIDRRLGDSRAACRRLRVVTELDPDNLHAATDLASVLHELDRLEEATGIYQQILAKKGNHVQPHMGLGWIASARGYDEAARAHFTVAHQYLCEANATDPNNLHTLTQLAAALRGMNRPEEATPIYQKMLAMDPKHAPSHMGLGWIACEGGDNEVALAHFKTAAELNPSDPHVHISLGKAYMQMGQFEEAEVILRQVIVQSPNHSQVRASLGALARKRHDLSCALKEFRAAAESDPKNLRFRVDLARTFCDLTRWDDAKQTFRSVLEDSPRNLQALLGLATVAKAQGNLDTARAMFEEASSAAPLDPRPKRELRRLQTPGAYDWQTEIEEAVAAARAVDLPVEAQLEAAKILVEYGLTEAARPVLSRLEARFPAARQLLLVVRQIDRMGLARLHSTSASSDLPETQLESFQGFHEMPVPGSDTVLIVFGGTNNRLWMTFSLLHKILRKTGVSVIYCRDLQRLWYAGGIIGMGDNFQSTVEGFRTLVTRYGATRILTLGNCIGCLGALRYGLSLGAQGVLGLSPKLRMLHDLEPHERTQLREVYESRPAEDKDVHREYLEVSSRPNVTLIFGEDCAGDAYNAKAMADVGGVTLAAIPHSSDTDSVKDLLVRGLFEPLLQDFVASGVVSQKVLTQISTSRNP
jgi:tetratricopeptide (TPR) repeat protein